MPREMLQRDFARSLACKYVYRRAEKEVEKEEKR